ncbi:MAG: cohesin domain-containing protein [Candidatus Bathyarchaeia archaeon]|nr:cohesin domain-containing protein [Candidatus Bathyarchaeia archaeon]
MSLNKKLLKGLMLTLILMVSFNLAVLPSYSQARPKISVEPKENRFSTETTSVGATFTVNIVTSGWEAPGLYSYELKLYYDPTLLEAVDAKYPPGHFLPAPNFEVPPEINKEKGYVLFGVTRLGDVPGSTGSGTLATITFKIIKAPAVGKSVSCELKPANIILLDPAGNSITEYDVEPAIYEFYAPKPPLPYLKVLPESVSAQVIGQEVSIDITVQDLSAEWKVVGFEWKLIFDTEILEYVNATEGDFLKKTAEAAGPDYGTYFYAVKDPETNYVISFSLYYKHPWPPEVFPQGSGTLATITFKATSAGACSLPLTNVILVDVYGNPVETRPHIGGYYAFAPPWLSVTPKEVTLKAVGETFDLNVVLNNLAKSWMLVGVEFKVRYNTTLLETTPEMIKEGPFLKGFADTWFQVYVEEDYGLIGILILPLPNGTWPLEFFPEGTGILATLTFKAIWQHETEDTTDYLRVEDIILANVKAEEIPIDAEKTATEGKCKYTILKKYVPPPPPAPERVVDVFTQYEIPYGGQGLGAPSDAFAPQGQVKLYAKVTYREEPVAGKPVAYQIRGPAGYEFLTDKFSDSKGLALLEFTVPASPAYFGIWNITVSADVAGQVVSDYVFFRVGWLASVEEIIVESTDGVMEIGGIEYQKLIKGKSYPISSVLKVITMQPPHKCVQLNGLEAKALLVYSGLDELKQPLFSQYLSANIGYFKPNTPSIADMINFVLNPEGRKAPSATTWITIPRNAFSGIAEISGNVYTDFPWYRGVPYSPSTTKQVYIAASVVLPTPPTIPTRMGALSVQDTTARLGSIFTVNIIAKDIDADAHIVGFEFRLKFEKELLTPIEVIEGDFVKQFGDTFLTWYIEEDVLVGIIQLPPWPGAAGWMSGSGTLAQIKFQAISAGGCMLTLTDAHMINSEGILVEFNRLEYGVCRITT